MWSDNRCKCRWRGDTPSASSIPERSHCKLPVAYRLNEPNQFCAAIRYLHSKRKGSNCSILRVVVHTCEVLWAKKVPLYNLLIYTSIFVDPSIRLLRGTFCKVYHDHARKEEGWGNIKMTLIDISWFGCVMFLSTTSREWHFDFWSWPWNQNLR